MSYLTYSDYREYGGTLDETTFDEFEFEAETIINWYTFDRLKDDTEFPEAVKRCMMKLIQLAKLRADALVLGSQTTTVIDETSGSVTTITTSAAIASQSNDGVSVRYNTVSASEIFNSLSSKDAGNEIEGIVQRYLQGVVNSLGRKVLYRGLYPDE